MTNLKNGTYLRPQAASGFILIMVLIFTTIIALAGQNLMRDSILETRLVRAWQQQDNSAMAAQSGLTCLFNALTLQALEAYRLDGRMLATESFEAVGERIQSQWQQLTQQPSTGCSDSALQLEVHDFHQAKAITQTRFCALGLPDPLYGSDPDVFQSYQYATLSISRLKSGGRSSFGLREQNRPAPMSGRSIQAWEVTLPTRPQTLPATLVMDAQGRVRELLTSRSCE